MPSKAVRMPERTLELPDEPIPESAEDALYLWETGAQKESRGCLGDAINCYRKALRLDPNVESLYIKQVRELQISPKPKISSTEEHSQNKKYGKGHEQEQEQEQEHSPDKNDCCWLLDCYPNDILLRIVEEVVLQAPESWINLSLTCSTFNKLCFHNSVPYKAFAEYIYSFQHYSPNPPPATPNVIDHARWAGNYDRMLKELPYVKFQGVYISIVNYLRHGVAAEGSLSFVSPVQMVTYFRYLRFYPDGTCLRLVTTDVPNQVVNSFTKEAAIPMSSVCRWSLGHPASPHQNRLQITRTTDKYNFVEELIIAHQAKKLHHRLKWLKSYSFDSDGQRTDFSLRNEKPFNFSRVTSYPPPSSSLNPSLNP
ncbi:SCF ubiquitin ligase complex subunit HRT3 Ecym_4288 [Eremothecium cymbalariae DBVPG|uniref:F-box protein Hrt3/FBXO9 C-terminal domain-containing protein n=1 Tax=Eremothecium cymbalariae (strain CBS 270.75 / DBVPG 7215 / KCTC 17166 / NRRL Y-17582) TaxID=931890 RepID=G8JTJ8_ERECY|nr:hypothetical protein Ecym_4288 [Eremothecium cymbalariae DBVPG\